MRKKNDVSSIVSVLVIFVGLAIVLFGSCSNSDQSNDRSNVERKKQEKSVDDGAGAKQSDQNETVARQQGNKQTSDPSGDEKRDKEESTENGAASDQADEQTSSPDTKREQRPEPPVETLLANGDFEADEDQDGSPDDWSLPDGASWEREGDNHFLRLTPPSPGSTVTVHRTVEVAPEHRAYRFRFRVRYTDLEKGAESWHDGRMVLDFKNEDGDKIESGAPHPNFSGSSDGWETHSVRFIVPDDADRLMILPALFQVKGGRMAVDDLELVPIKRMQVTDMPNEPRLQSERMSPGKNVPPQLKVVEDHLENEDGERKWLQGVAVPSLEWSNEGEKIIPSIKEALRNWNAEIIRLPVTADRWFGRAEYQDDKGKSYRRIVDEAIRTVARNDAYLVVDLHRYRAPRPKHVRFWRDVARRYKDHPAVIFGLYNEPHDISWDVWQNGGEVRKDGCVVYVSPGMQALIETVRQTGARNVVTASGLKYGYDLSGVLNGYALEDEEGRGIMYESHLYPWKSDWRTHLIEVAEHHPILIGEVGAPEERLEFIPPEQHEEAATWVPDALGLIQKHKLNWTGWSFHTDAAPAMLKNWSYEPTEYWGEPAKKALNGKPFELETLR